MKKLFVVCAVIAMCAACGGGSGSGAPAAGTGATPPGSGGSGGGKVQLNGAGATFPYPLYSKWFSEYNKLHPNVEINYQSQGSGFGIQQIQKQTVFFGATDGPMTPDQLLGAPGKVLHF